ncbi:MAG: TetR/AcrR family transcriptional regulator [Altererythrobacter sp.]
MTRPTPLALKPRKSPSQARSTATVEAIHTATIQLLLTDGVARLTTTRVAERAGVSVGTMYQYYPHKEALLFALVTAQLEAIAAAMENAAADLTGRSLCAISDGIAAAWLDAKTADIVGSRAIYGIAAEFDIVEMTRERSVQMIDAIETLLTTASDAVMARPREVAFMLLAVMGGSVRTVLERGARDEELEVLRAELPLVCRQYLAVSAHPLAARSDAEELTRV